MVWLIKFKRLPRLSCALEVCDLDRRYTRSCYFTINCCQACFDVPPPPGVLMDRFNKFTEIAQVPSIQVLRLQVQVHKPTISDANEIKQDSRKLVIVVIHT